MKYGDRGTNKELPHYAFILWTLCKDNIKMGVQCSGIIYKLLSNLINLLIYSGKKYCMIFQWIWNIKGTCLFNINVYIWGVWWNLYDKHLLDAFPLYSGIKTSKLFIHTTVNFEGKPSVSGLKGSGRSGSECYFK